MCRDECEEIYVLRPISVYFNQSKLFPITLF